MATESIHVSEPEAGLVRLQHTRILDSGLDMSTELWLARDNADWLRAEVDKAISTYGYPETEARRGEDLLVVFVGGHEQAPVINVQNERSSARRGGIFAMALTPRAAQSLVDQLAAL